MSAERRSDGLGRPSEPWPLESLGTIVRAVLLGAGGAALVAAAAVPLVDAWIAAVVAGVAGAVLGSWSVARRLRVRVRDDFVAPLDAMREALSNDGEVEFLMPTGAPLVAGLARVLNARLSDADELQQRSIAKLVSVESAFDRLHAIVHSLAEGIVVVDRAGCVVLTNPTGRQVLAAGEGPVEGRPLCDLLPAGLREACERAFEQLPGAPDGSLSFVDIEAGGRWYSLAVVRARSHHESEERVVLTIRDETGRREVSLLKDEILSSVSHELRTPLTNIRAFAEILDEWDRNSGDEWREFARIIRSESERMSRLIDNVIEYAKLNTGKVVWREERFDLSAVVRDAVAVYADEASAKGLSIRVEIEAGAPVRADRRRVAQVLVNLLDNAVTFTAEGGTILIRVAERDGHLRVSVDDDGPGVPEAQRERVFENLSQLGDPMTGKPAGAGLGLAICRGVVSHFGGRIWCAASDRTQGASFCFELPILTDGESASTAVEGAQGAG